MPPRQTPDSRPAGRTVLLLHPSSSRYGADLQLLALASGLDPERYRPVVVLPERGPLGELLEDRGVETHYEPVAALRRSLLTGRGAAATAAMLVRSTRRLARLARDRHAVIVHTNTSTVLSGHGVARGAGARHVVHVREIYAGAGGATGRVLWPLLRRRLERADALVCVSAAVAAQFRGAPQAQVIHDGIVRTRPAVPRDAARAALRLPARAFVVAVIGRISDWKGQDTLAHALATPRLAELGAVGLVVGDAAPGQEYHETALRELHARLGLGDRLRLLGFRDDVETVLGAADAVAVTSSRPEALPNSALEAAAAGRPMVASADGGTLEIVRDGVTGRLVAPGDAEALSRALAEIAADPEAARRMGEAAAADVRERFEAGRMVEDVQACYDRITR